MQDNWILCDKIRRDAQPRTGYCVTFDKMATETPAASRYAPNTPFPGTLVVNSSLCRDAAATAALRYVSVGHGGSRPPARTSFDEVHATGARRPAARRGGALALVFVPPGAGSASAALHHGRRAVPGRATAAQTRFPVL